MAMEKERLELLVVAAQHGNNMAMNELFNAFYNDLYYFALKTIKDEQTALDVTQEAFVEIINTLPTLKEPAAFVTWAKQITYHQCTRYFKKKKDVIVDEDEDGNTVFDNLKEENAEFIPDSALDRDDFKQTILSLLNKLSEEQRSAVMMYYFDEMSIKQIAEIQGVTEGTVKSRLNYARQAIKASVVDYENKNGVKLHAVSILPLFKWVFDGAFSSGMSTLSAQAVAEGVATATGAGITASVATAAGSTAAASTGGLLAKMAAWPLVTKIVAGAAATTIVVGGGATVVRELTKTEKAPNPQETIVVEEPRGSDYEALIDGFVSSPLNTFELYVGEMDEPLSALWLKDGKGKVYTSNTEVVVVSTLGIVTAVGEGTAYVVIAESDSMFSVYRYDVYSLPDEADLSNLPTIPGVDFAAEIEMFAPSNLNTFELKVGSTHSPTAAVWAKNGGSCYTSDFNVVTVAANGSVTAQQKGTAYVVIKSSTGMYEIYKYIVK